MKIEKKLIRGIFSHEIKNRFRCCVKVNGEEKICYVASSSRLTNFIELTGKEVLLLPSGGNANSTEYTLIAVKYRNSYILLELSLANAAVAEQIGRRFFSFLGKRKKVLREKTVAGYKTDFFIVDTNTLVEVKTVISVHKEALFPTIYSERSIKQLKHLSVLLDEGYKCCMLFAILSPSVKKMKIDKDTEFSSLLVECIKKGLCCKACRLKITEQEIFVNNFVSLSIEECK